MDVKLTLRIDENAVTAGKAYARAHGRTVSEMVETFLLSLDSRAVPADPVGLGPVTRRLAGLLAESGLDEAQYEEHLAARHGL